MSETVFYLVRHGDNDLLRHAIAGRQPNVHLNDRGRTQAERLGDELSIRSIEAIYSSPLERAYETAQPLARKLNLPIQTSNALIELDFAEWTSKSLPELEQLETWKQWKSFRTGARIPGGESILEAQARMVAEVERLRRQHPGRALALFSHGDPIRTVLLYYLGMPLDFLQRLAISTASVSILAVDDWGARLRVFNLTFGPDGL